MLKRASKKNNSSKKEANTERVSFRADKTMKKRIAAACLLMGKISESDIARIALINFLNQQEARAAKAA